MFNSIDGLPLHPLVVHGVVVLLPLAILGTIAIAVRRDWRVTFGPLVVAIAVVATALIPVATQSGEQLEKSVGDPGEHADLGDALLWFALPVLILSAALVILERRRAKRPETAPKPVVFHVVAALACVASLAAVVQVYRVGESGAREAWGGVVQSDG